MIHPRQHHIGHYPACGIAEHERFHSGIKREYDVHPGDTDAADSDEGDEGRNEGIAVAPEASGVDIQDGVEP